ncbi:hypothetical protein [Ruficoccus sp. ZRK36]|uniref:hypothetical protein n=1 Tax=Ruficoccus sp. ZRK36 TaxID=2866311 RepID=UPI001C73C4ED|nr:hypothetical protein [Ruficoccus sp. ZRK36]QYY36820.1 hypothetical protein K0V07_04920 [Ruficoccus sp. ZRK36]
MKVNKVVAISAIVVVVLLTFVALPMCGHVYRSPSRVNASNIRQMGFMLSNYCEASDGQHLLPASVFALPEYVEDRKELSFRDVHDGDVVRGDWIILASSYPVDPGEVMLAAPVPYYFESKAPQRLVCMGDCVVTRMPEDEFLAMMKARGQ